MVKAPSRPPPEEGRSFYFSRLNIFTGTFVNVLM
jgi:hypothetical protein